MTDIDEARVIKFSRGLDRQTGFRNPHNYGNMSAQKKLVSYMQGATYR